MGRSLTINNVCVEGQKSRTKAVQRSTRIAMHCQDFRCEADYFCSTGNVQGLGANQIAAFSMDGVLFLKSIQNVSEISKVSEISEVCPKFGNYLFRNIANF